MTNVFYLTFGFLAALAIVGTLLVFYLLRELQERNGTRAQRDERNLQRRQERTLAKEQAQEKERIRFLERQIEREKQMQLPHVRNMRRATSDAMFGTLKKEQKDNEEEANLTKSQSDETKETKETKKKKVESSVLGETKTRESDFFESPERFENPASELEQEEDSEQEEVGISPTSSDDEEIMESLILQEEAMTMSEPSFAKKSLEFIKAKVVKAIGSKPDDYWSALAREEREKVLGAISREIPRNSQSITPNMQLLKAKYNVR